jgi:hypothetical protein
MQSNHPSIQGKRLFPAMISIAKKESIRGLWSVRKIFLYKIIFIIIFLFKGCFTYSSTSSYC